MNSNIQELEQHQKKGGQEYERTGKFVPNWIVEVMEWIKRTEMANSALSTSCRTFKQLCWPKLHGNVVPKRIVPYLEFSYALTGLTDDDFGIVLYRQPQNCWLRPMLRIDSMVAPPEYIGGIKKIIINVHEEMVLNFVSNIRHLLQSIYMKINFNVSEWELNGRTQKCPSFIHRLLLAIGPNKIFHLSLNSGSYHHFIDFDRAYPGITDLAQTSEYKNSSDDEILDFLFRWLLKRRSDGKQKRLKYWIDTSRNYKYELLCAFIERIKEEFSCSKLTANFCIWLPGFSLRILALMFAMENDATGELLAFYRNANFDYSGMYLIRHPRGEEEFWRQQAENAFDEITKNTMTEFKVNYL